MADVLSEHKEGGDDKKPDSQNGDSSGMQCAPSAGCGEDSHQNEISTLQHSSRLQKRECGSVSSLPAEAREAKSSEEGADNPGRLMVQDGSETAENIKMQEDESKLVKDNVSQAKDPPDRENFQDEEKMLVSEQNESPLEGSSNEILSVSTKSSETLVALNDKMGEHQPPCTPAVPEAALTGDVVEKSGTPIQTGASSAVGCQESPMGSSKPASSTEKSTDLESSGTVSSDAHQERLIKPLTETNTSSKSSTDFSSSEMGGIEGSSVQSSSISSANEPCHANEVEHNVGDSPSQSSLPACVSKSSSTPAQTSSAQQESGDKVALLVSQGQIKGTEPLCDNSEAQCPEGNANTNNKSQDGLSDGKVCVVVEGEKSSIASEVLINPKNHIAEGETDVEQSSWNHVNVANETGTETLPLIVATHSLSQQQDVEECTEKEEQTALASTELEATKEKVVPSLESEPLKPVTIGSSLQPLEEIQEASVVEDTTFNTDMVIIDSSADEADSIGGLVINNVIGAADGVVDFQTDEVEAEKELTDISASAPQLGDGGDSGDEHGPSAKRRRLENGPNSVEDKSDSAKRVILKVIPVKNGHGVWDSQKLQEVLLSKGTILLQIHASKESMELFEPDKNDKKIDFTAIMAETKDDEHDHMLSFGNVDPECDDPLAVTTSHTEATSLPSYGRPFSHSHGRSTALQPAMSRPGFKHLQTPQQYHMKNEVLGLPTPLEFDEPHMNSPDWSGMDTRTVAFPESQASPHSPVQESLLPHTPGPQSKVSRKKVCPECGKGFCKAQTFRLHVRSHRLQLCCDVCSFTTRLPRMLRMHQLTHKKKNPGNECYICHKYFVTDVTLRIHQKKIHGIYACRYCDLKYRADAELKNHLQEQHGFTRKLKGYVELNDSKQMQLETSVKVPDATKSHLTCQLCKIVCRNKYQLKIHLAQHLGISSKEISDELLEKDAVLQKHTDTRAETDAQASSEVTTFKPSVKCELLSEEDTDTVDRIEEIPSVCNASFKDVLICNSTGQPLSKIRSNTTLQVPSTITTNELTKPEVIPATCNPSFKQLPSVPGIPSGQTYFICNAVGHPLPLLRPQILLQSSALSTTNEFNVSSCAPDTSAVYIPSKQLTTNQYSATPAPEASPSTSFSSNSQTSATTFIANKRKQSRKGKGYSKKHSREAHPIKTYHKALLPTMTLEESEAFVPKRWRTKTKIEIPCDVCGEFFSSSKALRKHKVKHKRSFVCVYCNFIYKSSHRLMRHQKTYHKDKYRCRFACSILFDSHAEVINHYKEVHNKDCSRIECPHCHKGYIYKASLMNHLEKCKECPPDKRPAHVCGNCEGFFPNMETYNDHAKICLPSIKKKDQGKDDVHEDEEKTTAPGMPQNLAESTTDVVENFGNTSHDDADTSDNNVSSDEEHGDFY